MKNCRFCALLCVSLAVVGLCEPLSAQSLAAVAKKTEEARAKTTATRVYTNKDLVDVPHSPSATIATSTPVATTPAAIGADPASASAHDEAYWRGRMDAILALLATDQRALVVVLARVRDLASSYNATIDANTFNGRTTIAGIAAASPDGNELARLGTERDLLNAKIDADTKAIADLKEEGRIAGARPGWLR